MALHPGMAGDMPFAPMDSFERDVDYCSAALLLTRRDCFVDLGGFDPVTPPPITKTSITASGFATHVARGL